MFSGFGIDVWIISLPKLMKQVIVVEDIVDTGNTMRKLMNVLAKYEPAAVKGTPRDLNIRYLHVSCLFSCFDVVKAYSVEQNGVFTRLCGV